MRGILLLNGEPYAGQINAEDAYVVCCDGAYEWAKGRVRIDKNVGDYDSLPYVPEPPPSKVYPNEKDFTDGELAMNALFEKGVDTIEIYGGGGGREDHFLGNLHLLYLAYTRDVSAKMITENSVIFTGSGKVKLKGAKGATFSVFPFGGPVHIINSTGCKYAYPEMLGYGECRGISNVVESNEASVEIDEDDCALIIVNRGKV